MFLNKKKKILGIFFDGNSVSDMREEEKKIQTKEHDS